MSLLLTVYNTSVWKTFVDASGLPLINESTTQVNTTAAVLQPTQPLSTLSALLSSVANEQTLWLAVVQAEYFLADALENGDTLAGASQQWEQQTRALLDLQRKQRRKLQLFNLHQALAQPTQFRQLLSPSLAINNYPEHPAASNLSLLAACQYLAQQPELQALNTLMQASVLPLCESETLIVNIEQILLQNHALQAAAQERDLVLSQLHQVQEELESGYLNSNASLASAQKTRDEAQQQLEKVSAEFSSLQKASKQLEANLSTLTKERDQARQESEKKSAEYQKTQQKNNQLEATIKATTEERDLILTQLHQVQEQLEQYYLTLQAEQQQHKHALLARDKQQAKEQAKLEAELRKTKARAANAEYAGQLLQKELEKLRASISWKAATPVRMLGRLIKKNDPEREQLMQEIGLLLTSEYFDVNWYLRTYTDVAESQINPAEHYLLHGAAEGRLPGPLFDGNWYLQHYPDVAASNMNPLLHFVMYGQQEGRTSSPKLLTNNQNAEE
jgi:myosin heavy subunit